ncbi:MAG TPA: carboxymuconolactone decarboxylase family protein [Nitrospirales bacterium]|nr:carboxymuconolactone decarboxylase family protein [Nitrospira sp. MA-1]HNP61810.1 carboxymuconolactone decarboxylase family protein [Nitrospirales bacterium]
MSRLPAINPEHATGQAQRLLKGVESKLGFAPNIMRTMANSSSVLQGYLDFSGALSKGSLSPKLREQIALAVSEANDCQYCLAAHSAIGRSVGLSEEALGDSRRGESPDPKEATLLAFTRNVVTNRGWVSDEEVAKLRKAGFSEGDIVELIANISLTLFTNYFNHIAATEIDFPAVSELEARV